MRRPLGDYELLTGGDEADPAFEPLAETEARRAAARLALDPEVRAIFRSLVAAAAGPVSDAETLRRIGVELAAGRVRILRRRETAPAFPSGPPEEKKEEAPKEEPKPQKRLYKLTVRLAVNPNDASAQDDLFVLTSTDGSYRCEKTVKDDKTPGDRYVDLVYTDLDDTLSYTLYHYPDARSEPRTVFQGKPFWDIAGISRGKAKQKPRTKKG